MGTPPDGEPAQVAAEFDDEGDWEIGGVDMAGDLGAIESVRGVRGEEEGAVNAVATAEQQKAAEPAPPSGCDTVLDADTSAEQAETAAPVDVELESVRGLDVLAAVAGAAEGAEVQREGDGGGEAAAGEVGRESESEAAAEGEVGEGRAPAAAAAGNAHKVSE